MTLPVFGKPSFPSLSEKTSNPSVKNDPGTSNLASSDDGSTDRGSMTEPRCLPAGFSHWSYSSSPYWNLTWFQSHPPSGFVAHYGDVSPLVRPSALRYSGPTSPASAMRSHMTTSFDPTQVDRKPQETGFTPLPNGDPNVQDQRDLSTFERPDGSATAPIISILSQVQPATLGLLNLNAVKDNHILLYCGVLAIQTLLLPRFSYHRSKSRRLYGVTLTMYGHTFHRNSGFASKTKAKVEVCRAALEKLKSQNAYWIIPNEPTDNPSSTGIWDWVRLLKDHCIQNGLPLPEYTKIVYDKSRGYSYQICLQGAKYSSPVLTHTGDLQARNMAAHRALRELLVFGTGEDCQKSAQIALNDSTENLLAQIPRAPPVNNVWNRVPQHTRTTRSMREPYDVPGEGEYAPPRAKRRRTGASVEVGQDNTSNQAPKLNSNLLPISNRRFAPVDLPIKTESTTRWTMGPGEIVDKLKAIKAPTERLNRICDLLSLEIPELRVERVDGTLVDTEGVYNAAAYFHDDPFFARAGAIGRVDRVLSTKSAVSEICAESVVQYILGVVEEDLNLERENKAKQDELDQWMTGAR